MKITFEILGILLAVLAATSGVLYLLQRQREKRVQKDGVVVYATLLSAEPARSFSKQLPMIKITLRLQEPDKSPREVVLRSRIEPGQQFTPGARLPVVVDPKDPRRVYPATPESAKRAVLTGSRQERRIMQSHLRSPNRRTPQAPRGYQPPPSKLR